MNLNLIKLIIILIISSFTFLLLVKDYKKGLCAIIFLLVFMPRELYVELGGGLPTLTGFRGILIVFIFFCFFSRKFQIKWHHIPHLKLLILLLIAKTISLAFAFNFNACLNRVLVYFTEILLFYIFLVKRIEDDETINGIIYSMAVAVFIIALVGFFERYTQFNPVDYISLSSDPRFDPRNEGVIYSTFSHPIHMGVALAMGWPICLYMTDKQSSLFKKRLFPILLLIIYASLYFSGSRGPWLSFIIAAMLLLFFKYPAIKPKLMFILILASILLTIRTGIYYSIYGLVEATFNPFGLEGDSFYYRFELFTKAYTEISKSFITFLFGYGEGAVHSMDLSGAVSYGTGRVHSFWSWDNEFAQILIEGGFVGLILNLMLYSSIILRQIKGINLVGEENRPLMVALIASNSVFIFMMTNVSIFSPQIHFIFWTNVAIGANLSRKEYGDRMKVYY